jgi:Holliday junction resolvase RusA-like endonuclease
MDVDRLVEGEGIVFVVLGKPAPGGSKTAIRTPGGAFGVRPASKRTKPWMTSCEAVYRSDWDGWPPLDAPLEARLVFYYERPRAAAGLLHPLKTGNDLDKLCRSTLDPLQAAGVISNDRRIVRIVAERRFGSPERAEVEIVRLPAEATDGPDEAGPVEQLALA